MGVETLIYYLHCDLSCKNVYTEYRLEAQQGKHLFISPLSGTRK